MVPLVSLNTHILNPDDIIPIIYIGVKEINRGGSKYGSNVMDPPPWQNGSEEPE
jgi:hypothetical protein